MGDRSRCRGLLGVLLFVACSTEPAEHLVDAPDGPCRAPDWPELIDFGSVSPNLRYARRLPLESFDCPVESLGWVRGGHWAYFASQSRDGVTVEFLASAPAPAVAVLEARFAGAPTKRVAVRAENFPERIFVQPETGLRFRSDGTCPRGSRSLSVSNFSDVAIELLAPPRVEGPFYGGNLDPRRILLVSVNETTTVRVGALTATAGSHRGAIELDLTYGGWTKTFRRELELEVEPGPLQIDTFTVPGRPKVDILFVIDDGPSMSAKQMSLQSNLHHFGAEAASGGVDMRIAVTAMSSSSAGQLRETATGLAFVSVDDSDFEPSFRALADVGHHGEGDAVGLARTTFVLAEDLQSGRFLREDAVLSVIFISDREDGSPGPVESYIHELLRIKGLRNTNLFSGSAVTGTQEGCSGPGGEAQPESRFREVVERTGGVYRSICAERWFPGLDFNAPTWRSPRSRYFLSNQPMDGSISVRIDGVSLPPRDAMDRPLWTYDFATNSINLSPFVAVPPGVEIAVEYQAECL